MTQQAAPATTQDLQKILESGFENEALKRIQDDPEMFKIVTDIEQNLGTLTQMIISGSVSPKTAERLQAVVADGVALLAACIAFGSVEKTPGSIMVEVDRWNAWVDETATAAAIKTSAADEN